MADELSPEITQFVQTRIDSVEQLSVLLMLYLQPNRVWTVGELTRELRSSEISIQRRLEGLYSRNVFKRPADGVQTHVYAPLDDGIAKLVEELAMINLTKPYRIIDLIYSRKSNALQEFANAFKIKGDKE